MVVYKHINRSTAHVEDQTQYELITVSISAPMQTPDKASFIQARPIEFNGYFAIRFSTMCPYCCQGFIVELAKITTRYGHSFVACPTCGRGYMPPPSPPPSYVDPFNNPFSSGLLKESDFDSFFNTAPPDDNLTVADKLPMD
jgi:hypothetical protein